MKKKKKTPSDEAEAHWTDTKCHLRPTYCGGNDFVGTGLPLPTVWLLLFPVSR